MEQHYQLQSEIIEEHPDIDVLSFKMFQSWVLCKGDGIVCKSVDLVHKLKWIQDERDVKLCRT